MPAKDRWLLPEGVEEMLPDEARHLEAMRRHVLDLFDSWGYELVMPPLIEYLESLLTGVSQDLDLQTFKVTDHQTGRLMGIRPDMTPQAARIDAHYLKREVPVRLCYTGSVLRTRPDEFGGSREPIQLGAELFGHNGPESDAEILNLMIATLRLIGISEAHLDLGHVGVFRGLAEQAKLNTEQEVELFDALQRKARNEVEQLLDATKVVASSRKMMLALLDLAGGAEVLTDAKKRLKAAPASVMRALDNLQAVAQFAAAQPNAPALHFDLAELSGYHYYTGVVFSAFVPGHGRAVAKGGRYNGIGRAFGRDRAATGFGADLRQLLKLVPHAEIRCSGILAPYGDDAGLMKEITRLRSSGERVVVQLPGGKKIPASGFGCDRELIKKNGRWSVENSK